MSRTTRSLLQRHAQVLERRQAHLFARLQGKRADELPYDRAEVAALTTAIFLIHREIGEEHPMDPRRISTDPLKGPTCPET